MAVEWLSRLLRLGVIWFGRTPREPPDPYAQSWMGIVRDVVYVPLVEPIVDDFQDSCWRLILYLRKIVEWDLILVLWNAYRGTLPVSGTDLFSLRTPPVDEAIV